MSSVYTPSPVALANITIPSDGDARDAAAVNAPLQAIADGVSFETAARAAADTFESARTTPLADLAALAAITTPADGLVRHVLGYGIYVFKTSATTGLSPFRVAAADATAGGWVSSTAHETSIVRLCGPGNMAPMLSTGAAITPALLTPAFSTITTGDIQCFRNSLQFGTVVSASSHALAVSIGLDPYLIDGATLSQIRIRVTPQNHVDVPALMPQYGVLRTDLDQTTAVLLSTGSGLATDTHTANALVYETAHWNVFTPDQNNVIDRTKYSYSLQLWNEGGTNALALLVHTAIEITHTTILDARRR